MTNLALYKQDDLADAIAAVPKATVAADLRNAALVMEHLGASSGGFVDSETATVCLDGALMLATNAKLLREIDCYDDDGKPTPYWMYSGVYHPDHRKQYALDARHYAAQQAMAELLPDRCHEHVAGACPFDGHLHNPPRVGELVNAAERVYHYNDFVCEADQEKSVAMLIEVAEKVETDL